MSLQRIGVTKELYWCDKCESYIWIDPNIRSTHNLKKVK